MPHGEKYQDRTHFEADRQKKKLQEIGISLRLTKSVEFKGNEFSTVLVFDFMNKPLKEPLETMLIGFEELDEFLAHDVNGLYKLFASRFNKYKGRLRSPVPDRKPTRNKT